MHFYRRVACPSPSSRTRDTSHTCPVLKWKTSKQEELGQYWADHCEFAKSKPLTSAFDMDSSLNRETLTWCKKWRYIDFFVHLKPKTRKTSRRGGNKHHPNSKCFVNVIFNLAFYDFPNISCCFLPEISLWSTQVHSCWSQAGWSDSKFSSGPDLPFLRLLRGFDCGFMW